ncbi:class I SAM-dependent methyltransferase [Paenibacillaceae bacterium WGS1546]|uniref:class I SAM-dependent methyltransferase n=1 Tax=Cohnella sp. WGS1546 TaxID=3366810 RepID=UPI00372D6AAC
MEQRSALPAYPQTGVASTCRSYEEYRDMFGLDETCLRRGPVLDVAGGASSFTAQLRANGVEAAAADPFYEGMSEDVIAAGFKEIETSSAKIASMASAYDWSYYGSPERHRAIRERSMRLFAEDFSREDAPERYFAASLPDLPFADDAYELVLCSHFLFLYADAFGERFHEEALDELVRVLRPGGQLRIYPLITLKWEPVPYLPRLLERLRDVADADFLPTGLPFTPVPGSVLRLVKKG